MSETENHVGHSLPLSDYVSLSMLSAASRSVS